MWKSFIASRYFWSKKNNKFTNFAMNLSIFVQTFTIAALILIFSIFRGYHEKIIENVIKNTGYITISKDVPFDSEKISNKIHLKNKNLIEIPAMISKNEKFYPIIMHSDSTQKIKTNNNYIPIILNSLLAKSLDYKIGDMAKIIIPTSALNQQHVNSEIIECEIVNIQDSNNESNIEIQLNLSDLQKILNLNKNVYEVQCETTALENLENDIKQLKNNLAEYKISSWKETNHITLKMLNTEEKICIIILFLLLFLSFLVMFLAIGLFIYTKKNEIKILKLLKASTQDIVFIFTQHTFIMTFFNIILGSSIGILLANNINKIIHFLELIFNFSIFHKDVFIFNYIPTSILFVDVILVIFSVLVSSSIITVIMSFYMDC